MASLVGNSFQVDGFSQLYNATPLVKRKKTKKQLTPQQCLLVKHLLSGLNITESARLAGYSDNGHIGQLGSQALEAIREKMPQILDRHGLTDDALIENYLKPLLNAETTEFAKFEGKITDEKNVIAWDPRRAGLDMAFNLKGSYAAKQTNGESGSSITVNVLVMGEKEEK